MSITCPDYGYEFNLEKDPCQYVVDAVQPDLKIAEKAKNICSIEWIVIESAIRELNGNHRIRDELLQKVVELREAVIIVSKNKVNSE